VQQVERKIQYDPTIVTMDKFIPCLVKKDYSGLVESGEFTEEEKHEAWTKLFLSYLDCENSKKTQKCCQINQDISDSEWKITVLELCIIILKQPSEVISDYAFDTCEEVLKSAGFDIQINRTDFLSRIAQLKTIMSSVKSLSITLQLSQSDLKRMSEENENEVKHITENDFVKIFINLNSQIKYGFEITPENTTVSKYCAMINIIQNRK